MYDNANFAQNYPTPACLYLSGPFHNFGAFYRLLGVEPGHVTGARALLESISV